MKRPFNRYGQKTNSLITTTVIHVHVQIQVFVASEIFANVPPHPGYANKMPRYLCDYCQVWLTHDSQSVRKAHNAGRAHLQNVQDYYARVAQEEAQKRLSEMSSSGLKQKENGTLNLPHVFAFPPKPVYTGFALPPPPLIIPSTMYTSAPQIPQAAAAPLAAAAAQTLPTAPSRANAAQSQQQRPNRHRPNGHRPMHLSRN